MSFREFIHLSISTIVLSIAFGIALAGGTGAFKDAHDLFDSILISFLAVSIGFICHEMAHRIMARKYGFFAEYYMSLIGLGIAFAVSFTGWIYAAPGAVQIYRQSDSEEIASGYQKKDLGKISLAGPLANILLVPLFFLFGIIVAIIEEFQGEQTLLWKIVLFGMTINSWLALFNMIPFGSFDGRKIFDWNKIVWGIITLLAGGLYLLSVYG